MLDARKEFEAQCVYRLLVSMTGIHFTAQQAEQLKREIDAHTVIDPNANPTHGGASKLYTRGAQSKT